VTAARDLGAARTCVVAAAGPASAQARILTFLDAHADALDRSCRPGHLTASAAVVDPSRSRAAVILHRKLGRWLQPGGHADGDGDLAAVALTEATEETGLTDLRVVAPAIDLDVHAIPARPGEPAHLHLDVRFLALATPGARLRRNHESLAARWVGLDDLDCDELALDISTQRLLRTALLRAVSVTLDPH
jgi:8-oxo-dGTP pyrophosphatase MutT (NUDIX family)